MFVMLQSCAIEKSNTKKDDVFNKRIIIDVDSDVNDDFDKALVFLKQSDFDQAVVLLNNVIQQEKRLPAPYVNLGIAHARKNELDMAEKYLLMATELETEHPIANNELGLVYRRSGRFEEAKKAYKNALSGYPNYLPAIKNLGILCEIYMRDLECALEQFEEYQSYMPEDKSVSIWILDLKRRLSK